MGWTKCDDIDGTTDDVQTVVIGYDGDVYTMHLGPVSRAQLDETLTPWLANLEPTRRMPDFSDPDPDEVAAAAAAGTKRSRGPRKGANVRPDIVHIRAWAQENGYPVRGFGRISKHVLEAYDTAMTPAR